jgi:hypothetical protein
MWRTGNTMKHGKFIPRALLVVGFLVAAYIVFKPTPQPVQATILVPVNPALIPSAPFPEKKGEVWNSLMKTPDLAIDLDPTSVKIDAVAGAFTVEARFRMSFGEEFTIDGTKELASHYVNVMTVNCTEKTMYINKSTVFTKLGKELATKEDLGIMPTPKNPQSFVNIWTQVACADLKNIRPPTII